MWGWLRILVREIWWTVLDRNDRLEFVEIESRCARGPRGPNINELIWIDNLPALAVDGVIELIWIECLPAL